MVIKYPGYRYHPTAGKRLVANEAEEAELGRGWSDSPVQAPPPEPESEPEAVVEEKPSKKPGKK
jgi:hypothetical protein